MYMYIPRTRTVQYVDVVDKGCPIRKFASLEAKTKVSIETRKQKRQNTNENK